MDADANFKRAFLISLIISLIISALIGIVIFLIGDFNETSMRILLTTLTIGGFSLTGLCCAALHERQRFPLFSLFGMILSVIAFIFITSIIWEIIDWSSSNGVWKTMIIMIIVAVSTAHISLLLLIKSERMLVNVSLSITILFIALVALELIILTLGSFQNSGTFAYRILGVFAVLDVLGTIVTPILVKVTSMNPPVATSRTTA